MGQLIAPEILDRLIAKKAWSGQISDIAETPGRPDNPFETVRGDEGAHGRFDAEAKPSGVIADPLKLRIAAAFGLTGLAALVGVAGARLTTWRTDR